MKRRNFIVNSTAIVAAGYFFPKSAVYALIDAHREICKQTFNVAAEKGLERLPIRNVVAEIGKMFIDAPYEAHTLEEPEEEELVINLKVFDCVTLVENSLALARCIKKGTTTFDDYAQELQTIRYRGGQIDEYPSRLHYFSDWIFDNIQKGIVRDVNEEIGGAEPFRKTINFMSENRGSYRQLSNDEYYKAIQHQEEIINEREYTFIPKGNLHMYEENIREGDILAFTTNIRGLDIQHTALAIRKDENVHVLHAPMAGRSVEITEKNLMMYLAMNKRMTGIMVTRPKEV